MERTPEPELMDEPDQAWAYARADFEEVNTGFVAQLRAQFPDLADDAALLDLGCGPGDIPLRLARTFPRARVVGVDGAEAMLALARKFIILDLEVVSAVQLYGLAAAMVALGVVYWLMRERDDRLPASNKKARRGAGQP